MIFIASHGINNFTFGWNGKIFIFTGLCFQKTESLHWEEILGPAVLELGEGNGIPLQYSCVENPMDGGAWWAVVHGVARSRTRLSDFTLTFHFHAFEEEMATHSSVLAWRIPGMAEPGGLPSIRSHRVGHDWSDLAAAAAEAVVLSSLTWETNTCLCSLSYKTQMKATTQHIFDLWNIRFQSSSIPISTLQYPANWIIF